jgi:geranylgeranylglycerol-phosphate geranylgeranyltransferase
MLKKLRAIWELMRLEHGLMIAIAIVVGSLIAQKELLAFDRFILAFFTALFLEGSTFALNDYYDYDIDIRNRREDRPLVRGDLSRRSALYVFAFFFPLGIICPYFINFSCFVIALVTAFFAVFYDVVLKKVKLLGNFFIAYFMAVPFIFGGAAVTKGNFFAVNLSPVIFIVAVIAFLAGVGREIMKDVIDFKGDKKEGVMSFPVCIGVRNSNYLSSFFYFVAVILGFIPFFVSSYGFYYLNYRYLVVILAADVLLLSTCLQLIFNSEIDLKRHRRFTLVALFIGLLAFLVGAFSG